MFYNLIILLFLVPVTSFASSNEKKLTVFIERIPPYSCLKDGKAVGVSVDLIKKLAIHAGIHVEFRTAPWPRAMREAVNRDNIVLAVLNRTETREDDFDWLFQLNDKEVKYWLWQLKGKGTKQIVDLAQLENKKFAYSRSGILLENFKVFKDKNSLRVSIFQVTNREQAIRMLIAKRVDYISGGDEELYLELDKYGIPKTVVERVFPIPVTTKGLFIAVGKNFNQSLKVGLTNAFEELGANHLIDSIHDHYQVNKNLCSKR